MITLRPLLLGLALALACTDCTTVTPTPADVPAVASFDGAEQNSGIVAVQADGAFLVTAHLRDRYNALVAAYGAAFIPQLVPDAGLSQDSAGHWMMTPQAMVDFATMCQWRRMGRASR